MASFFESMTEDQFVNAMSKAFENAMGSTGGPPRSPPKPPKGPVPPPIIGTPKPGDAISATVEYNVTTNDSFLRAAGDLPAELVDLYDGDLAALNSDLTGYSDNIRELQAQYGGFRGDFDEAAESVSAAIGRYNLVTQTFLDETMGKEFTEKMKLSGDGVENFFQTYFESEAVVAQRTEDILSKLITQHSNYVNEMGKDTVRKLSTYPEALGVDAETIAHIIERQIVTTGKATTDILDEVGAYAVALEEKTGQPFKAITRFSTQMIANTKQFGIVTAEEATRAAASLMQLGIRYEDLVNMQNKFADFASTADMSGIVSQITGVQLDAMELSYRFSEDPDAAFEYLREQFIAQGFTPEMFKSLSKGLQRQLQDAIGMDINQVFGLIDPKRQVVDGKVIDQVQKDTQETVIDTGKAFAETAKNGLDVYTRSSDNLNAAATRTRKEGLIPQLETLMEMKKEAALTGVAIGDLLSDAFGGYGDVINKGNEAALQARRAAREGLNEAGAANTFDIQTYFKAGTLESPEVNQSLYNTGYSAYRNFTQGAYAAMGPVIPQSLPPLLKEIMDGVTDSTLYDPYVGGLKDAGGIVGTGFTQGVEDSLNVSIEQGLTLADSKTIANKLLGTPEEIGMMGLEAGERYAADFSNGMVQNDVGDIGLDSSVKINTEDIGLSVKDMTDAVVAAIMEDQTATLGQQMFAEVLQPIIEAIRDEIINLKKSQIDLFNKESNIDVMIGEEKIVTIVRDAIIRNPTSDNLDNSILIGTSG